MVIAKRMMGRVKGDELVVFLIGMRINRWWKPHRWLSVAAAMPRMLRELNEKPELGFLGSETWPGRTIIVLQYWRSMDALLTYAKNRTAAHLPAWRAFNKRVGTNGDVGIWHETYRVRAGDYENIYVNMPPFGLGKVGELTEATGKREHAKDRLVISSPE
jgi:Domain of unknown function (DUF4188)